MLQGNGRGVMRMAQDQRKRHPRGVAPSAPLSCVYAQPVEVHDARSAASSLSCSAYCSAMASSTRLGMGLPRSISHRALAASRTSCRA